MCLHDGGRVKRRTIHVIFWQKYLGITGNIFIATDSFFRYISGWRKGEKQMIAHKRITKIAGVLMAAAVCLCLCAMACSDWLAAAVGDSGVSMEYETALFDTDQIMSVNIIMDQDEWEDMLANAADEAYYKCDVEINGTTFQQVGIRPKGNTSLSAIVNDPTTDRYSLKLEFDHYIEEQTCFGLDKLILNNNYADATNMKEALIYDMFQYLGADASLYNYASISVNGEYWARVSGA